MNKVVCCDLRVVAQGEQVTLSMQGPQGVLCVSRTTARDWAAFLERECRNAGLKDALNLQKT